MTPRLRKFALTAHVTSSVGWLGTVAGFQALAIAAVTSRQPETVRGFYLGMSVIGWYVIVPFCLASLITGLFVSLGTPWGLFRHYWVLIKFLITVVAALVLFGFTQTLGSLGDLAADQTLSMGELGNLKQSPVLHSGGGMLALLAATILAVYKPWGMTRYGQRVKPRRSIRFTSAPEFHRAHASRYDGEHHPVLQQGQHGLWRRRETADDV
jgi:hypothetical protein